MTETVDFEALAAARGVKVELLTPRIVSSPGTGTDYDGFDDVSSVYVTVAVQLRRSPRAPSLTVLLEGSDDGNSWSTLHTFSFTNDGTQTATATTPNAHLRVSWSVGGGAEWFFREVSAAPASLNAPGGGSHAVLRAEVPLTNAQIIALGAGTAVEVVPAPTNAEYIKFFAGEVKIDAVETAYTTAGGAFLIFALDATNQDGVSTILSAGSFSLPGLLGGDGEIARANFNPSAQVISGQVEGNYLDASQGAGAALVLVDGSAAGAYSGGDAANSGAVVAWYTIENIAP